MDTGHSGLQHFAKPSDTSTFHIPDRMLSRQTRYTLAEHIRTADTHIVEAVLRYYCWIVDIAAIDDDGIAHQWAQSAQVETAEFFPVSEDKKCVYIFCNSVGICGEVIVGGSTCLEQSIAAGS